MNSHCFPPSCQPSWQPVCPPCPAPTPKKREGCFFGKVEQKNTNEQNATIYQSSEQRNIFIAKCGEDKKKKHGPYEPA